MTVVVRVPLVKISKAWAVSTAQALDIFTSGTRTATAIAPHDFAAYFAENFENVKKTSFFYF
jgi:hypothetical protein